MARMKYCKKCNTEMNLKAKICPNCGAKAPKDIITIVLIVAAILFVLIIISAIGNSGENSSSVAEVEELSVEKIPESEIQDFDYLTLYDNYKDYEGKYVRIAGCIASVDTNVLDDVFITFDEGLSGLTGEIYCTMSESAADEAKKCKEGDYVCIVGKCSDKTINTLNIKECYIDSTNEPARSFYENMKEKRLNEESEAAAAKEEQERIEKEEAAAQAAIDEENFKVNCQSVSYADIARDSQGLKGQDFTFTGEVIQVSGSTYRMNVTLDEYGIYSDTIVFNYDTGDGDRILENDIVTIWGTSKGLLTYTSIFGEEITVPEIDAKYVSINNIDN